MPKKSLVLFPDHITCPRGKWAIPYNKSTIRDRAIYLPWDKKFVLTPLYRTDSSLRRIRENLLKFTREYRDILVCQYPLGQTLKIIHRGVPFIYGITRLVWSTAYSCSSVKITFQKGATTLSHRRRNRWGRSGHGLTTFLSCYYKAKLRVRRVEVVTPTTSARNRAPSWLLRSPWSVYCCASGEMSNAANLLIHFTITWPDHSNFASYPHVSCALCINVHSKCKTLWL